MSFRLPLLAALLVLAGCLQTPVPAPDPSRLSFALPDDWIEHVLPNGAGHDHLKGSDHANLSTPNFSIVGWNPLTTDHMGNNGGGYFCGDVKARNGRSLAVVHSFTSDVAFMLIDVTDPQNPTKIGELVMEQTHVWDVAMTPDQGHVVLATSPFGNLDESTRSQVPPLFPRVWFQDACTSQTHLVQGPERNLPFESGVVLVDISNPVAPSVLDYRPLPVLGGHSVVAQDVAGQLRILVTASNLAFTNYYAFFGLLQTPQGARLDLHHVYQTDAQAQLREGTPYAQNHDGYFQRHPVTQKRLAFLADGNLGLVIMDVEDPRAPRFLARWDAAAGIANPDHQHFAHSVLPLDEVWDGRHYTFLSEECLGRPRDTPSCLVYALDTTDPAKPSLAGAWTLPFDAGAWTYPGFSPHYMAVRDRILFVAHWHAGLWALDVSTATAIETMPVRGVFVPTAEIEYRPDGGAFDEFNFAPTVADVLLVDEHLMVFDGTTGVYLLDFDASMPIPAPAPWPLRIR